MTPYAQGFMEKCAARGVDAEWLVKSSATLEEIQRAAQPMFRSGRVLRRTHEVLPAGYGPHAVPKEILNPEINPIASKYYGDKIIWNRGLDNPGMVHADLGLKGLSPHDKQYANYATALHERNELAAPRSLIPKYREGQSLFGAPKGITGMGHMAPSVILKEHNLMRTAPDGVRNMFSTARNAGLENYQAGQLVPGFDYAKSPRLSRHAIKNIDKIYAQRLANPKPAQPRAASRLVSESTLSPEEARSMGFNLLNPPAVSAAKSAPGMFGKAVSSTGKFLEGVGTMGMKSKAIGGPAMLAATEAAGPVGATLGAMSAAPKGKVLETGKNQWTESAGQTLPGGAARVAGAGVGAPYGQKIKAMDAELPKPGPVTETTPNNASNRASSGMLH